MRMPCRAQPAMISGSDHCLRTVAVLIDSSSARGAVIALSFADAMQRKERAHACAGELRIGDECGRVREPKERYEVQDRTRSLLPPPHHEVRLMAVEPGDKYAARLVKARRRAEHVPRQRHG